jgi:predicted transglutaminase-like cysteine proteinase
MVLTDRVIRLLQQVNTDINSSIRPLRNPPGGWKIYPLAGDCNDYALTKRSALIRLGFPAGALRIAVTKTRLGEAHAILVIKTDIGDLVLDNLSPDVKSLRNSGYTLRMMSGPNPQRWVRI